MQDSENTLTVLTPEELKKVAGGGRGKHGGRHHKGGSKVTPGGGSKVTPGGGNGSAKPGG